MKIKLLEVGINVSSILWKLRSNPQLWNQNTMRTQSPSSPHHGLDDIWARYAADPKASGKHESVWYPSAETSGVKILAEDIFQRYKGKVLGGVLITRIPPGESCKPHRDDGWHAREYEKFAVQIDSAPGQKFCFEGEELETAPGDLFWFDNQYTHWVTNPTKYERITLIVCLKR